MATLQEKLQQAKKLTPSRLQNDLFKYIRSIEKDFLDSEKKRISEESKDVKGNPLGFYSKATELITGGKKKAGDPFTGIDTGDWFKGFFMQEVSGTLRFGSKDPKTNDILKSEHWLSDEIFGLSDDELKDVINEKLLPFFIDNVRKII